MAPHNPVTATYYMSGEENYKLTTYNCGDTDPERNRKIEECKKSNIIFCQEITNNMIDFFENYTAFKNSLTGQFFTAILIKKTIEQFRDGKKINEEKKFLDRPDVRQCTVKLKDMILISWHGDQKINREGINKIVPKYVKDRKKDIVKALQEYAFDLATKNSLPVIIGGDFNLTAKDTRKAIDKLTPPQNYEQFIINPADTHKRRDIDYFVIVFPKYGVRDAIALPPLHQSSEDAIDELAKSVAATSVK